MSQRVKPEGWLLVVAGRGSLRKSSGNKHVKTLIECLEHTSLCSSLGMPFLSLMKSSTVPETRAPCTFVHLMILTALIEPFLDIA